MRGWTKDQRICAPKRPKSMRTLCDSVPPLFLRPEVREALSMRYLDMQGRSRSELCVVCSIVLVRTVLGDSCVTPAEYLLIAVSHAQYLQIAASHSARESTTSPKPGNKRVANDKTTIPAPETTLARPCDENALAGMSPVDCLALQHGQCDAGLTQWSHLNIAGRVYQGSATSI